MRCPKCNIENKDSAKFCSKCGTPLKTVNKTVVKVNNENPQNNSTKYIIIGLIIIIIALVAAFAYVELSNQSAESENTTIKSINEDNQPQQSSQSTVNQMTILSGSFSTASSLSAKTYATLYVGPKHAGENVIVQIYYSRDGSNLNNGNMVPVTVDSAGYIDVSSADAYRYYPDYAVINLYNTNNQLLDTRSVSLSPTSGTQTF